jgi:hypothetical protein
VFAVGGKRIGPAIVHYLASKPGKPVALQRMASDLRLEERQVQQAIVTLRNGEHADTIEVVQRGQVWRWLASPESSPEPPAPTTDTPSTDGRQITPTGELPELVRGDHLEVMGSTRKGDVVATDKEGRLYHVRPL